jgi:hypothetical protein
MGIAAGRSASPAQGRYDKGSVWIQEDTGDA